MNQIVIVRSCFNYDLLCGDSRDLVSMTSRSCEHHLFACNHDLIIMLFSPEDVVALFLCHWPS